MVFLRPPVSGSHLFDVLLEFMYADFRVQRYLVRQWIHFMSVYEGVAWLRSLLRNRDRYAQGNLCNFLLGEGC